MVHLKKLLSVQFCPLSHTPGRGLVVGVGLGRACLEGRWTCSSGPLCPAPVHPPPSCARHMALCRTPEDNGKGCESVSDWETRIKILC